MRDNLTRFVMIILTTNVSRDDALMYFDDVRRENEMMHCLIMNAFDVIACDNVRDACTRVMSRLIDECDDLIEDFDTNLMQIHRTKTPEYNTENFIVFDVIYDDEPYAQIMMKRVN